MLPTSYQDMIVRVYSKKPELVEAISEAFENFQLKTYGIKAQVHSTPEKKKRRYNSFIWWLSLPFYYYYYYNYCYSFWPLAAASSFPSYFKYRSVYIFHNENIVFESIAAVFCLKGCVISTPKTNATLSGRSCNWVYHIKEYITCIAIIFFLSFIG